MNVGHIEYICPMALERLVEDPSIKYPPHAAQELVANYRSDMPFARSAEINGTNGPTESYLLGKMKIRKMVLDLLGVSTDNPVFLNLRTISKDDIENLISLYFTSKKKANYHSSIVELTTSETRARGEMIQLSSCLTDLGLAKRLQEPEQESTGQLQ